ncbi:RimK/LysX family protein [bacterium]|jgi:hypothetical protein|nr:RimK/LysX family protein [bacterium]
MKRKKVRPALPAIGWREWVALPELGIRAIKAKVDTGAASSSLHAMDVEEFQRAGKKMISFRVHPLQRNARAFIESEAELLEYRHVKSSGGHQTLRPVIVTTVEVLGIRCSIELTLASRDTMGFRMLLGREALAGRFVVDSGRSFLGGKWKE